MLDSFANFVNAFMGIFQLGGNTFMSLATGIIPTLIVLMTALNAMIKLIGEERFYGIAHKISKYTILRYTLLPIISLLFLTNPMAYTFGRFVDEKYKPAFYDAAVSFCHPILGIFPHANPAELFVYTGISLELAELNIDVVRFGIIYFLTGIIVILIRGIVTERITLYLMAKERQEG